MKRNRRMAAVRLGLLVLLTVCLLACAVAWTYQAACAFEVASSPVGTQAGQEARIRLWQSDCLLAVAGHACYDAPRVEVKGLPPGAAVQQVEWLNCHESDLILTTEPTTPPGSYPLTVSRLDAFAPGERVVLEVAAP